MFFSPNLGLPVLTWLLLSRDGSSLVAASPTPMNNHENSGSGSGSGSGFYFDLNPFVSHVDLNALYPEDSSYNDMQHQQQKQYQQYGQHYQQQQQQQYDATAYSQNEYSNIAWQQPSYANDGSTQLLHNAYHDGPSFHGQEFPLEQSHAGSASVSETDGDVLPQIDHQQDDAAHIVTQARAPPIRGQFERLYGFARRSYGWYDLKKEDLRRMLDEHDPLVAPLVAAEKAAKKRQNHLTRTKGKVLKEPTNVDALMKLHQFGVTREEVVKHRRPLMNKMPMNPMKRRRINALIRNFHDDLERFRGGNKVGRYQTKIDPDDLWQEGDDDHPEHQEGNQGGNRICFLLNHIRNVFATDPHAEELKPMVQEVNDWMEENVKNFHLFELP